MQLNPYAKEGEQLRRNQRLGGRAGLDGSEGVLFDPDTARLELVNGALSAFQTEFPGVDIREACNKTAPKVSRHSDATQVKAEVRRQISFMLGDKAPRKKNPVIRSWER